MLCFVETFSCCCQSLEPHSGCYHGLSWVSGRLGAHGCLSMDSEIAFGVGCVIVTCPFWNRILVYCRDDIVVFIHEDAKSPSGSCICSNRQKCIRVRCLDLVIQLTDACLSSVSGTHIKGNPDKWTCLCGLCQPWASQHLLGFIFGEESNQLRGLRTGKNNHENRTSIYNLSPAIQLIIRQPTGLLKKNKKEQLQLPQQIRRGRGGKGEKSVLQL